MLVTLLVTLAAAGAIWIHFGRPEPTRTDDDRQERHHDDQSDEPTGIVCRQHAGN
ncbi:MAG TPA: hypothetical protein VGP68_13270 [Gemmataceae bacterium]|nr:hypothetical protein [Gemmataceae bacterium]